MTQLEYYLKVSIEEVCILFQEERGTIFSLLKKTVVCLVRESAIRTGCIKNETPSLTERTLGNREFCRRCAFHHRSRLPDDLFHYATTVKGTCGSCTFDKCTIIDYTC